MVVLGGSDGGCKVGVTVRIVVVVVVVRLVRDRNSGGDGW